MSSEISRPYFNRIAGNVLTLLVSRGIQKFLSFVLLWVLVRQWSTEDFGLYSFLMAWIALASGISDLGLSGVGVRLWAENSGRMARTMGFFYRLRLLLLMGSAGISVVAWFLLYDHLPPWSIALVAVGLMTQFHGIGVIPFQAELNNGPPTRWYNFNRVITVATILTAVYLGAGIPIVVMLEILLPLAYLARLFREGTRLSAARATEEPAYSPRELFSDLAPSGLLVVLNMLFFRADIFLLMRMAGEHAVGLYAASYRVVEPLLVLPGILAATLVPVAISRHAAKDDAGLQRMMQRAARVLTLIQIALAFALSRHTDFVVSLVFGPAYSSTAPMMALLVWTLPISAWAYAWSMAPLAERRYGLLNGLAAAALLLNVGGNLLLIPAFKGLGCAAVTVATEFLWSVGLSVPYMRRFGGGRIAVALVACGTAAFIFSSAIHNLASSFFPGPLVDVAGTFAGLSALAATAYLLKLVTHDDLQGLSSYVRSLRTRSR